MTCSCRPGTYQPTLVRNPACPRHGDDSAWWARVRERTAELAQARGR